MVSSSRRRAGPSRHCHFPPGTLAGPSGSDSFAWVLGRNSRPFVEFGYGIDWLRHKSLEAEFPSIGALELKAGYLSVEVIEHGIVELDDRFIHGTWYSSDLGGGSGGTAGLAPTLGRFGFGTRYGYGYDLKTSAIVPYFPPAFPGLNSAPTGRQPWDRPTSTFSTGMKGPSVSVLLRRTGYDSISARRSH